MVTSIEEKTRSTPERIFNSLNAYQETAALKTAIELDVFTAIGDGSIDAATLAGKVGAAERGIRILCDFLTIHGFLTKEASHYALSDESARFLDRRSPACVASMSEFLGSDSHKRSFETLTASVRHGGTADASGDNTRANDEYWVRFAHAMAPHSVRSAQFVASVMSADERTPRKVLDIAAGHGMYGIAIAEAIPDAEIVAVDWPNVLEVARDNARKHGVAARYSTRPGSAFEADLGGDYDIALLTNILHHFDASTCEKLIRRVHAALKPDGKAITVDLIPNEDRVTPPTAARFALVMLATTDAGDAYAFSEYERMFRNAGFARTTLRSVPDMPNQLLVSEK
jgi:2-polyprenyl-3-methyl-5-hydroxy-6-metoxy-1,4-benzoquinol methylase